MFGWTSYFEFNQVLDMLETHLGKRSDVIISQHLCSTSHSMRSDRLRVFIQMHRHTHGSPSQGPKQHGCLCVECLGFHINGINYAQTVNTDCISEANLKFAVKYKLYIHTSMEDV